MPTLSNRRQFFSSDWDSSNTCVSNMLSKTGFPFTTNWILTILLTTVTRSTLPNSCITFQGNFTDRVSMPICGHLLLKMVPLTGWEKPSGRTSVPIGIESRHVTKVHNSALIVAGSSMRQGGVGGSGNRLVGIAARRRCSEAVSGFAWRISNAFRISFRYPSAVI